ncbi:MAG: hypothetical protein ACYDAJ_09050 [Nitrosotalea sp.]
MEPKPKRNRLDENEEFIIEMFSYDDSKLILLQKVLNENEGFVSKELFFKTLGIDDPSKTSINLEDLVFFAHRYYNHRELFTEEMSQSKVERKYLNKLEEFFVKLASNAFDGMDLLYEARTVIDDNGGKEINAVGASTVLMESWTEKGKKSFVPVVRLEIRYDAKKDQEKSEFFEMRASNLKLLRDAFNNVYEESVKSAKEYKEKMGRNVIFFGEDV